VENKKTIFSPVICELFPPVSGIDIIELLLRNCFEFPHIHTRKIYATQLIPELADANFPQRRFEKEGEMSRANFPGKGSFPKKEISSHKRATAPAMVIPTATPTCGQTCVGRM